MSLKLKLGGDEQSEILKNQLEHEIQAKFSIFNRVHEENRKNAIVCHKSLQF